MSARLTPVARAHRAPRALARNTRWKVAKIVLYCQPGAKQTRVVGLHDGKPKIQLKAPPVDGEANTALVAYLAKLCGVPKSAVTIDRGQSSRIKQVSVEGVSDEHLRACLTLADTAC